MFLSDDSCSVTLTDYVPVRRHVSHENRTSPRVWVTDVVGNGCGIWEIGGKWEWTDGRFSERYSAKWQQAAVTAETRSVCGHALKYPTHPSLSCIVVNLCYMLVSFRSPFQIPSIPFHHNGETPMCSLVVYNYWACPRAIVLTRTAVTATKTCLTFARATRPRRGRHGVRA